MERKIHRNKRKFSELKAYTRTKNSSNFSELFMEVRQYPQFFDENLVDDDRKIRLFYNNSHTHEIIFYYQLLKMIFESEEVDYQKYLVKLYDILENPQFQFYQPEYQNPYYIPLADGKIKKIMQEFLEEMGQGLLTVNQGLLKYPIMDKILIAFFRSILIMGQQVETFSEPLINPQVYQYLANYFEVQLTFYNNCLKFNQVDVFVYFQAPNQVYLAYISPAPSEQELPSSNQFYHCDPEEAFNISSVRQMVSEIDIPVDTECFSITKNSSNLNETEYLEYNYSHSGEARKLSKSFQQNSDLKFSYLINDDSSLLQNLNIIKSNKILEKELIGQKKYAFSKFYDQNQFFEIQEAPELQSATSPVLTPKIKKRESGLQEHRLFEKQNIYGRNMSNLANNISDRDKNQQELLSTNESVGFFTAKPKIDIDTLKRQAKMLFQNEDEGLAELEQSIYIMKSFKDAKSIKSINAQEGTHNLRTVQLPPRPPKSPSSFSKKPTIMNCLQKERIITPSEKNNISSEYTSSLILKQIQEPFQSNIRSIKLRARKQRTNISPMICF